MKKLLIICALCVSGCCISKDTKILSRKIAISTERQETELKTLLKDDLSPEAFKLRTRAQKLTEVTAGLADLLGAPKETE